MIFDLKISDLRMSYLNHVPIYKLHSYIRDQKIGHQKMKILSIDAGKKSVSDS